MASHSTVYCTAGRMLTTACLTVETFNSSCARWSRWVKKLLYGQILGYTLPSLSQHKKNTDEEIQKFKIKDKYKIKKQS